MNLANISKEACMFNFIRVKNKSLPDITTLSLEHRLMILAEQLVAITYLIHASEGDNILKDYHHHVIALIEKEV